MHALPISFAAARRILAYGRSGRIVAHPPALPPCRRGRCGLLLLVPATLLVGAGVLSAEAQTRLTSGQVAVDDRATAPSGATTYGQRPLVEVLRSLQDAGLTIVFTSELIRPEMTVEAEPVATEPRAVLEEVLAPHGLGVYRGPGDVLVVVPLRDPPAGAPAPSAAHGATEPATSADDPADRYSVRDEIVVRPSRLTLLSERSDAPFSLTREEIERLPHLGGDLFRALSLFPGTAANDVSAGFSVHGGRRDEVRIVLDGQELYDAFHLQDYDGALSIVPARSLGGASLLTGAFPASHGDRMGGVLDLRTTEPPARRRFALGVSALDALAQGSGRFAGGRGGWLVTGRRGSLDLAADAIGDEHPAFWDVLAKAELGTSLGHFGVHALVAGDELELRREGEDELEVLENDYRRDYGWLTHRAAPGDRLIVETVASWADVHRDRGSVTREEEGSFELRDRRDLRVLGLSQTWSLQLDPSHLLRWGWRLRRFDADFDYAKDLEPEIVILAPFSEPPEPTHRFDGALRSDHTGLWVSDRLSLFDRLTVELGIRSDRHSLTDDTLLSPRVNVAWRAVDRSVLRAAWGRFFQSQRPYELQVEDGRTTLRSAERSEQWVLGYEQLFAPGHPVLDALRVELFLRTIDNPRPRFENLLEPLNFFPEIEPDRVRIAAERSSAYGVEILLRGRRHPRFGWWLSYGWARSEDRIDGRTVPRALDQTHTVSAVVDVRLPRSWTLNLAWRYHTGWPTTPVHAPAETAEDDTVAVFGRLRSRRLPDYHRLDLRASRKWALPRGSLTFYVDIQNVYDHQNLGGFDLAPDEDEGTVELEEEHWPGLFPSVGFLWEF